MAYDAGETSLHAAIKVRVGGEVRETTVGRVLVSEILPEGLEFRHANKVLDKKALSTLIDECYRKSRNKNTVLLADRLRALGFSQSTAAGISICMDDMVIPDTKGKLVEDTHELAKEYERYMRCDAECDDRTNEALDNLEVAENLGSLEAGFVAYGAAYSERKDISYAAWREAGVPASVLKDAGVKRTRRS